MKKLFIYLVSFFSTLDVFATIRTVSNSPNTLAQFSTIQAAVDASLVGDTVYIHASSIPYAGATIQDKKLTIIGAGWAPQTNPNEHSSVLGMAFYGNSHGSTVMGIRFIGEVFVRFMNNLNFIRNYFQNCGLAFGCIYGVSTNFLIEGNFFNNSYAMWTSPGCSSNPADYTRLQNSLITNNVFLMNSGSYAFQHFFESSNVVLDHNLFYGNGAVFAGSDNFIFKNNIFVNINPTGVKCTWQNNITYNCGGTNTPWVGGTNVDLGGNIANTNPEMVDQSAVNANTSNPLLDFTILSGPANDSGTDGKDLGLLFDVTGFLNWNHSRNPKLPVVNNLVINSTTNPGGNLEIHLKATQAK